MITGSVGLTALAWITWKIDPTASSSPLVPLLESAVLLINIPLTILWPHRKRAVVTVFQRYLLNPVVRLLFRSGFVPFGYALVETVGRRTGRRYRTPVGNGLEGDAFWIIAEHGYRAGYVRNLIAEPAVRVKLRQGWRFVWRDGWATVLPNEDPLERQRRLVRWHPLRMLNAIVVRALGADLLVIRIDLTPRESAGEPDQAACIERSA
ncbi:nitroreductase/quinone reductase family protein [Nocardia concava]|uniref:nitroreductase/quinone reductase family protein n=1 Tax=Nocardia concava TaxID=257281 RepID=UPI000687C45D|nr:nitroreductase/quinone reductase family protein [Nocardia concava]